MNAPKQWALVLSGGGAKGLAHLGVLKALEEGGFPRPSLVAGTSMGAIVGGLYASGMSPAEMIRFALEEFTITDYLDSFAFKLNGPVGKIIQTGQILASLAARRGIDTGARALELFEKLTRGKTFAETDIPFRCNAVDLASGQEVVFSSGSLARAMRASMSFPVFFEPLEEGGKCLVDGGLADNLPVAIARKEGFKRVLAVNVANFRPQTPKAIKNGPQIMYRTMECVLHSLGETKRDSPELTINAADDATPFSFFRQKELIDLGERAVKQNLPALEAFFRPRTFFERLFPPPPRVCGL
jgi:NTE family protein